MVQEWYINKGQAPIQDFKEGNIVYLNIYIRTKLIAQVSYIPGHEIRIVSYTLQDSGNCQFY